MHKFNEPKTKICFVAVAAALFAVCLLFSSSNQKYANLFESERVGMIELPYLGEERLQKMGIPLGPRMRILQEAQISLCKDTTLCIV